jgi:hypothetical protein
MRLRKANPPSLAAAVAAEEAEVAVCQKGPHPPTAQPAHPQQAPPAAEAVGAEEAEEGAEAEEACRRGLERQRAAQTAHQQPAAAGEQLEAARRKMSLRDMDFAPINARGAGRATIAELLITSDGCRGRA